MTQDANGNIHDEVVPRDPKRSEGVPCPGETIIWSEISDTQLGLLWRSAVVGDWKTSREHGVLFETEMGDPCCEMCSSSSSMDCFSQLFCTLTMA